MGQHLLKWAGFKRDENDPEEVELLITSELNGENAA
jgi:hypothetical protein